MKKEDTYFIINESKESLQMNAHALQKECMQSFHSVCKRGIYKELNRRKLITDTQLNYLLGQIE